MDLKAQLAKIKAHQEQSRLKREAKAREDEIKYAQALWPWGGYTFGASLIGAVLFILTLVLGGPVLLGLFLIAPASITMWLTIYGLSLVVEFVFTVAVFMMFISICDYFDHKNGWRG